MQKNIASIMFKYDTFKFQVIRLIISFIIIFISGINFIFGDLTNSNMLFFIMILLFISNLGLILEHPNVRYFILKKINISGSKENLINKMNLEKRKDKNKSIPKFVLILSIIFLLVLFILTVIAMISKIS